MNRHGLWRCGLAAAILGILVACGGGGGDDGDDPLPPAPPVIDVAPKATSAEVGASVTFSVRASGAAPLSYQWLRNGTDVPQATSASLKVGPLTLADHGSRLAVRVSDGAGSVTSASALLTVTDSGAGGGTDGSGLAAGFDVTLAVRDDGSVVQLSTEVPWTRLPSTAVAGSSARRITGLSASSVNLERLYALAVGRDGKLYGWGINEGGKLGGDEGNGPVDASREMDGVSGVKQALATSAYSLALGTDGRVWHWPGTLTFGGGRAKSEPLAIGGLQGVVALAALSATTAGNKLRPVAIKDDGSVWELRWDAQTVMGANGPVQTHTGSARKVDGLADIASISCSFSHCLALTKTATVLAWGMNRRGQFGNGTASDGTVATPTAVDALGGVSGVAAMGAASVAITADGKVWTWGDRGGNGHCGTDDQLVPKVLALRAKATQVAAGWQHAAVRLADGSLWGWGANQGAQLGDGSTQQRCAPVQAAGVALD